MSFAISSFIIDANKKSGKNVSGITFKLAFVNAVTSMYQDAITTR